MKNFDLRSTKTLKLFLACIKRWSKLAFKLLCFTMPVKKKNIISF